VQVKAIPVDFASAIEAPSRTHYPEGGAIIRRSTAERRVAAFSRRRLEQRCALEGFGADLLRASAEYFLSTGVATTFRFRRNVAGKLSPGAASSAASGRSLRCHGRACPDR
jgi:hypothetical protein